MSSVPGSGGGNIDGGKEEAVPGRVPSRNDSAPEERDGMERMLEEIRSLRSEMRQLAPKRAEAATLASISEDWLPRKLRKIAAPECFESRVRIHLLPMLGEHTHETLLPSHVEDMMEELLHKKSPQTHRPYGKQTVNHVREAGRQLVEWAQKNGRWGDSNPFAETKKLKLGGGKKPMLTNSETYHLLRYGLDVRWRPLFALAIYLGPRRKTIFHIKKSHVRLKERLIDFHVTKTGEPILDVPIPDELLPYLEMALRMARSEWLFSQATGKRMSAGSHVLSTHLENGVHRIGAVREGKSLAITFHGLRRVSSTLHQEAGCHPWVVSKVLGHSQESLALFGNMVENMTASRYSEYRLEFIRAELNKLRLKP